MCYKTGVGVNKDDKESGEKGLAFHLFTFHVRSEAISGFFSASSLKQTKLPQQTPCFCAVILFILSLPH